MFAERFCTWITQSCMRKIEDGKFAPLGYCSQGRLVVELTQENVNHVVMQQSIRQVRRVEARALAKELLQDDALAFEPSGGRSRSITIFTGRRNCTRDWIISAGTRTAFSLRAMRGINATTLSGLIQHCLDCVSVE